MDMTTTQLQSVWWSFAGAVPPAEPGRGQSPRSRGDLELAGQYHLQDVHHLQNQVEILVVVTAGRTPPPPPRVSGSHHRLDWDTDS